MREHAASNRPLSPTDLADLSLITLVAAGDRAAFEKLFLAHHNRVARFLSRFIRSRENLEEVVDDTFMTVWRSAKTFRHESRFSTWLIGIGYRTALNSMRGLKYPPLSQSIDELAENRGNHAVECEQKDWVKKGMDRLPPEQRETMELAYGFGYSIEEIAALTGSPAGTVKARMFHAREKLRHYLPALGGSGRKSYLECAQDSKFYVRQRPPSD